MIRARTWEEVKATRRQNDKATFSGFVTDLIVAEPEQQIRPQAFLVEQNPHWVLPVHYHLQHQFQVITAGDGMLGAHPVSPLCIHYASPQSGYGPLTAGASGISYLTLRANSDVGAWYLPESRERMDRGLKKQQKQGKPETLMSEAEIRELVAPAVDELIAPQESGLAAHIVRMPPHSVVPTPSSGRNGGRFYVVTKGSLIVADANLAGLATVFVSHDETLDIRSGSAGIEVLVLQFPEEARPVTQ